MPFACTLASGSGGNCILISGRNSHVLVDAGVSAKYIKNALREFSIAPEEISAVLVTHGHSDHISALKSLKNPVFAPRDVCELAGCGGETFAVAPYKPFRAGDVEVIAFETPHDTPLSFGYLLDAGGLRVAVCTDLGYMPERVLSLLCEADVVFLESNHDEGMLRAGNYPAFLKRRILGDRGHLSNETCAGVVCVLAGHSVRHVVLCHLSRENNSPDLALGTAAHRLFEKGFTVGRDIFLSAAPQRGAGEVISL